MSIIERLAARHDVLECIAQALVDVRVVGKVCGRQHRLDPVQVQRPCRLATFDARVCVWASKHEAPKHAGHVHVRAKASLAGYLVDAVRTRGSRADNLELLAGSTGRAVLWHNEPPRLARAAASRPSHLLTIGSATRPARARFSPYRRLLEASSEVKTRGWL